MSDELTKSDSQELTYEEAYQRLETILSQLESGELPLEQSLELYEQGAALAAVCSTILDEAELRVQQWHPNGEVAPMDNWQPSDSAQ